MASAQVAPAIQWQRALGGSLSDFGTACSGTTDDGSIVVGGTLSNDGDVANGQGFLSVEDLWVVKLDGMGDLEWQRNFGGMNTDWGNAVQQTVDGGYIVAGVTTSNDGDVSGNHGGVDTWIIKLDGTGNLQWQQALGGFLNEAAHTILQTDDGGFIVGGETYSNDGDVSGNHGAVDIWVVKLDSTGNLQWQRTYGGTGHDFWGHVLQADDGGYAVCGTTTSNDGDVTGNHGLSDLWIIKLDGTGNLQWQRTLGGSLGEGANSIHQTDNGYIVTGSTASNDGDVSGNHGYTDGWVVRLDSMGIIQWQRALGGTGDDRLTQGLENSDGGYTVVGTTNSIDGDVSGINGGGDGWVVELDNSGTLVWQKVIGGTGLDSFAGLHQSLNGSIVATGLSDSNDGDVAGNHGDRDLWAVKLNTVIEGIEESAMPTFTITPNPSADLVVVHSSRSLSDAYLVLTDALGRVVLREALFGSSLTLDLTEQPKGLYLLTLHSTEGILTQRLVME